MRAEVFYLRKTRCGFVLILLTLISLFSQTARGQITHIQQGANSDMSGTSYTSFPASLSVAPTAGNAIVVGVSFGTANPTISATDTLGNSYTQAIKTYDSTHLQGCAILYALNIQGGALNTVTVSFSSAVSRVVVAVHEYRGIALTAAADGTAGTKGSGTSPSSGSATTKGSGDLIFGCGVEDTLHQNDTFTAGSGFTKRVDLGSAAGYADEDASQAAAGSVAATWTLAPSSTWVAEMAAFKAGPSLAGIVPASGAVATSVTLTGINFGSTQGSSAVKFNGTAATPSSWSATSIVVPVPSGATTGNVVATVGGIASNGVSFTVGPTIASLSPASGIWGTAVTVKGTNFGSSQGASTVAFNGVPAAPTSWSNTSIVVPVPSGATTGNVVVTANGLTSTGVSFTVPAPSITSLSPTSGAVGTAVTVKGTNFGTSQVSSTVTFNGAPAAPTSWSNTSIVVPVPTSATTGNVLITVNGLTSTGVSFTVLAPSITSLSPTSGAAGTAVTIKGTSFGSSQGASTVTFNGVPASATSWSSTSIVAPVPTSATTGNVVVTTNGLASNGVSFTVTAPSITSLSPTSGAAGTAVTIKGTSFGSSQGASTVTFNGVPASPTSWSNTSIVAPVPASATTGNVVVTANGLASNGVSFTVSVPSITSLSPTSGAAGTAVTIKGTSFGSSQGTSTVTFNGAPASPTSWSNTSIVAPVPSSATTGSVVVTVNGQSSNGEAFSVPVPGISKISPSSGPVGMLVTITGTNLGATQGSSSVSFSGVTGTPTSWSATSIVVGVPNGATSGNVVVQVGPQISNALNFTVAPGPGIAGVTPGSAPVGASVVITGVGFGASQAGSAVTFNGTTATATSWSNPSITATVPTGATSGSLIVTVSGQASNAISFSVTPTIAAITPLSGPPGTSVTVSGMDFGAIQGTSTISFNGTPAGATSWSATSIVTLVPLGATTGNLTVTVAGQSSNGVTFTVVPPLSISGLSPGSGPVGGAVTIAGTSFGATQGSSTVNFNGAAATPTNWSNTSIVVQVPGGANQSPGPPHLGGSLGWTSIANTNLQVSQGVDTNPPKCPPNDYGNSNYDFPSACRNVYNAWNGGALYEATETLYIWGGGHTDYNGNELYGLRFGQSTPDLVRLTNPTVPISNNSYGYIPDSATCNYLATSPTCAPNSRHTYGGIMVDPSLNRLVIMGGSIANDGSAVKDLWTLDLTACYNPLTDACTWTRRDNCGNGRYTCTPTDPNWPSAGTDQMYLNFDASSGTYFTYTPNGCLFSQYNPLAPIGGQFTTLASGYCTNISDMMSVLDPLNRFLVFIGQTSQNANKVYSYQLSAPYTLTDRTSQVGASCASALASSNAPGLAYDPIANQIIGYPSSLGNTIYVITTSATQPWTCTSETYVGGPPAPNSQAHNLRGRFQYSSKEDAFIVCGDPYQNCYYLRRRPTPSGSFVTVTVNGQTSNGLRFTVTPNILSLSPAAATVGTLINITGTSFGATQNAGTVTFNGITAAPVSWSNTSITMAVPVGATSGSVVVTVGDLTSNGANFVVLIPPSIAALSPTSGSLGTPVSITGTNFGAAQGGSIVAFNGVAAVPSSWSNTGIVAAVPAGASTGNIVVTVTGLPSNAIGFTVLPIQVSLTSTQSAVTISQPVSLSATVQNDSLNAGVLWSTSGGILQTQSSAAATFSSTAAGVFTVTATSVTDPTVSASTELAVTDLAGVATWRNDTSRSGVNAQEYALTPQNVAASAFGKLFSCPVDGYIYGQPLWASNVVIGGATHNVVYVATDHDSVFAFDADGPGCQSVWPTGSVSLLASGEMPATTTDLNATSFGSTVGITGTPVIDLSSQTLYAVSMAELPGLIFVQKLHAIDITTGLERSGSPVLLAPTVSGTGYDNSGGTITFNPQRQNQRPALLLSNGVVYVCWGSFGDQDYYHGWVAGYSTSTLSQVGVFNDTPNGGRGGIWMSGAGPASDSLGYLYLLTGNGDFDANTGGLDYGDSFLKLAGSGGLAVSDWFTPFNVSQLNSAGLGLGSGGTVLLPDQPAGPYVHLMVGGGAEGTLYLLNRDNLGQFNAPGDTQIVQSFSAGGSGIYSTPLFWQNTLFGAAAGAPLQAYPFLPSSQQFQTSPSSASSISFEYPGATPELSAQGTSNAIVWVIEYPSASAPAVLHAYSAGNLAIELWNSSQAPNNRDTAGPGVTFSVPTIANGKVYIGTQTELDVYGLLPN